MSVSCLSFKCSLNNGHTAITTTSDINNIEYFRVTVRRIYFNIYIYDLRALINLEIGSPSMEG